MQTTIAPFVFDVLGIGFWAQGLETWRAARAVLRGDAEAKSVANAIARPAPNILPPTERRRASASVAVALEVALEAVTMARVDPIALPSVFASAYGDLAIVDYLCTTLAEDPTALSPIKFHNSVHNAAAGYWTIATGCTAPATALSAGHESFAAGLLEAATQAVADQTPVLLIAYDTPAAGALAEVAPNTHLFGVALILSPFRSDNALARLTLAPQARCVPMPMLRGCALAALARSSPSALALPLLEALAQDCGSILAYPLGPNCALDIRVEILR